MRIVFRNATGALTAFSPMLGRLATVLLWLFSVACLVLASSPAYTAEGAFVLTTDSWPPFRIPLSETNPNQFRGIDIDLLAALSQKTGLRFSVEQAAWARIMKMLEEGKSDIMLGIAHTPERAKYLLYSEIPYYFVTPVFYTQKGKGGQIQTYDDLSRVEIGWVRGSAYFEPFNSDTKLKKIDVATELQLIKMLGFKHLHVIIGTNPNLRYDILQQGLQDKVEMTAYSPPTSTGLYVAVSKKSPLATHMGEINQALISLVKTGEVNRIVEQYLGGSP